MAIDFSQVKSIKIPAVVTPPTTWTELTIDPSSYATGYFSSGSSSTSAGFPVGSFSHSLQNTGNSPRLKVYFTWSGKSSYTYTYTAGDETVSTFDSPVEVQLSNVQIAYSSTVIKIRQASGSSYREIKLTVTYNSSYDYVIFKIFGGANAGLSDEFRLTITKIEQAEESEPVETLVDVKKIINANNVILWAAKQSPYRRLEYVHFNGAEYFPTGFTTPRSKRYEVTFSLDQYKDGCIMGAYGTDTSYNQWILAPTMSSTGVQTWRLGNTTETQTATNLPVNTKRRLRWNISQSNSTYNATMNYYLYDDSGSTVYSDSLNGQYGSYPTSKELYVMAYNNNGNGATSYAKGNVYGIQRLTTSSAPTVEVDYVPCQRKSDNVCGFYDTVAGVFVPIVGTTITSSAAGPTVEENWDPSN